MNLLKKITGVVLAAAMVTLSCAPVLAGGGYTETVVSLPDITANGNTMGFFVKPDGSMDYLFSVTDRQGRGQSSTVYHHKRSTDLPRSAGIVLYDGKTGEPLIDVYDQVGGSAFAFTDRQITLLSHSGQLVTYRQTDTPTKTLDSPQQSEGMALETDVQGNLFIASHQGVISLGSGQSVFETVMNGSRTDKKHFGLGLSVVQELVRLHKGNIELLGTIGGGCSFQIAFPICNI